jgi:hypothetical protein
MKNHLGSGAVVVLAIIAVVLIFTKEEVVAPETESPDEEVFCTMDAMICPDGSAVGRVAPNCEFAPCPEVPTNEMTDPMIVVHTPREGDTITSPVTITGEARGNWFFEASFPITIVNWDGLIIGEGFATAEGDWMTTEFVPFTATISYEVASDTPYTRGAIILKKDNPSGLPEHDDAREFMVQLGEVLENTN